jgi:5-hydroxyisourate hydrolase
VSGITTHVLDTSRGQPAASLGVTLELHSAGAAGEWLRIGSGVTAADGRAADLVPPTATLTTGTYRLVFDSGAYFNALGIAAFYPQIVVIFAVRDTAEHYHVPLLLSPFGYSTYRGS